MRYGLLILGILFVVGGCKKKVQGAGVTIRGDKETVFEVDGKGKIYVDHYELKVREEQGRWRVHLTAWIWRSQLYQGHKIDPGVFWIGVKDLLGLPPERIRCEFEGKEVLGKEISRVVKNARDSEGLRKKLTKFKVLRDLAGYTLLECRYKDKVLKREGDGK